MSGESALKLLLQTLGEVLICYADLKAGARFQFSELNKELLPLEAFLKDSANMSKKTDLIRELEKQIRDVVYDVEDTIEICLTKASAAKNNKFRKSVEKFSIKLPQKVKSLRKESVTPLVEKILKSFGKLEIGAGSSTGLEQHRMEVKTLYEVVDFEDEETIIGYLKEPSPKDELDVISIIGMPGIGKSTLALKIYQNKNIVEEFEFRIWIDVSQQFNSRDVFFRILKRFTPQDTSSPDEDDLVLTVRACLKEKKFLLVFDSVWSAADWETIKQILPPRNRNGKVLVTSRDMKVGVRASISRTPHQMNFLTEQRSWELLQLIVFGNLQDCPTELSKTGRGIAQKCLKMPLTIVVIGGILKGLYMRTQSPLALRGEWEKVLTNMSEICFEEEEKLISNTIELSYDRLPNELRLCFLYMGVFPENEEILTSALTRLWIAEGFIRPKHRKSFEETAVEILYDLINMNLLMVEKKILTKSRHAGFMI